MKIKKLTLDDAEMIEAVQMLLATKGINMPVHSLTKQYTWEKETEVTFKFEVEQLVVFYCSTSPPQVIQRNKQGHFQYFLLLIH